MSLHQGLRAAFGGWGGLQTTVNVPSKNTEMWHFGTSLHVICAFSLIGCSAI